MNLFFSKIKKLLILSFLSALIHSQAFAATAVCTGKVESVGVHNPGLVYLDIVGTNGFTLCSVDSVLNGVTPMTCKSMYASALLAKANGSKINIYVDNAPTEDCGSIPSWHSSATRFLAIVP